MSRKPAKCKMSTLNSSVCIQRPVFILSKESRLVWCCFPMALAEKRLLGMVTGENLEGLHIALGMIEQNSGCIRLLVENCGEYPIELCARKKIATFETIEDPSANVFTVRYEPKDKEKQKVAVSKSDWDVGLTLQLEKMDINLDKLIACCVLTDIRDLFAFNNLELTGTNVVQHVVDTGSTQPIKQQPY